MINQDKEASIFKDAKINEELLNKYILTDKDANKTEQEKSISNVLFSGNEIVDYSLLTTRGICYPKNSILSLKPLTLREIKNFTLSSSENLNEKTQLNALLEKSIIWKKENGESLSYKQLSIFDVPYLIFYIRNLLSKKPFKEVYKKVKCPNTEHKENNEINIPVNENSLSFAQNDIFTFFDKWKNETENCIKIKTENTDFKLYLPNINNTEIALSIIKEKKLNETETEKLNKILFFVPTTTLLTKEKLIELYEKYDNIFLNVDIHQFNIIDETINRLNLYLTPRINHTCECGTEVSTFVFFQQNINIFFEPDISDELRKIFKND